MVVEKHEDTVLALHLAERRALGTEQEAHRSLGHVQGRYVIARLELRKVGRDRAAVPLLQRNVDGKEHEPTLLRSARDLPRQHVDAIDRIHDVRLECAQVCEVCEVCGLESIQSSPRRSHGQC